MLKYSYFIIINFAPIFQMLRLAIIEAVRARAVRALFLFSWQIFFPDLLSFDLLIVHLLHLSLQLTFTVLNVKNLSTFKPFLVAVQDVDQQDSNGQPNDQDSDHNCLETYVIDDRKAIFLVYLLVVKFFFNIAMCDFISHNNIAAWTVFSTLPQCIDVEEGAQDDFERLPEHVSRQTEQDGCKRTL